MGKGLSHLLLHGVSPGTCVPGWAESSGPPSSTPRSIPDVLWSRAQGCPSLGFPVPRVHVRGRGCLSSWESMWAAPASPDGAKSDRSVGREPAASDGEEKVDQRYGWTQKGSGRTGNSEGGGVGSGGAHTCTGAHVCLVRVCVDTRVCTYMACQTAP